MLIMLVTVLYFVQKGVRHGAYSVITLFATLVPAVLITMNYYQPLGVWLKGMWSAGTVAGRESLAMLILFGVFGSLFAYPALRYFSPTGTLPKYVDQAAAAVAGLLLGLLLVGMIGAMWFVSPLSQVALLRVDTKSIWPTRPDWFVAEAFGHVVGRTPNLRRFDVGAFLGETYASPMPQVGNGFWFASIPDNCRIFASENYRAAPETFFAEIRGFLSRNDAELESGDVRGFYGRTGGRSPQIGSQNRNGQDIRGLLVGIDIVLPQKLARGLAKNASPYSPDGEIGHFTEDVQGETHLIKVYRVESPLEAMLVPLISLNIPKRYTDEQIDAMLDPHELYAGCVPDRILAYSLKQNGADEAVIPTLVNWFKRAGKVIFSGQYGRLWTAQVSRSGEPIIAPVP